MCSTKIRKTSQIKSKRPLDSLAAKLELLSAKSVELENKHEKKDKKTCELEKKIESLESKLVDSVDELEQCYRRNCLLLHSVRESEDENTNVIMKTVKEEMYIDMRQHKS